MIDIQLLLAVLAGIAILLVLILKLRIQAFLALLISALTVGLLAGMEGVAVLESVKKGMGDTLGFVATIVGLGALFGAILEHSGGSEVIANALLKLFGIKRSPIAMALTGFIVAIPVFFDVAFVILVPLVYALQKRTGASILKYGIPLAAGLMIAHAFIPPTPGPVAVADILKADLGSVIAFGIITGIPALLLGGIWFGNYIGNKMFLEIPDGMEMQKDDSDSDLPPPTAFLIFSLISFPIVLILANTIISSPFGQTWGLPTWIYSTLAFIGHPFTALILANLAVWYILGVRRKVKTSTLANVSLKSLAPAGIVILITGAGGSFKQVLVDTGAGVMLAESMGAVASLPVLFGFLTAMFVRILQGSATVAMITAAGLTAPVLAMADISSSQVALVVIAIAAGATSFSHVNDSGFWLVTRYLGMSESQALRSVTVAATIIGFVGLGMTVLLWPIAG